MVTVKKATQNDFEKLLPLLFELDSRKQTQDEWQRLFRAHWDDHKNYFGYVMYDGENAVGHGERGLIITALPVIWNLQPKRDRPITTVR